MVSYSQLLNLKSEYKSRKKSNYAFPVILSLFMFGIAYFLTRVLWFSMIIPSAILLGTAGFAYKEHKDNMREKQKLLIPIFMTACIKKIVINPARKKKTVIETALIFVFEKVFLRIRFLKILVKISAKIIGITSAEYSIITAFKCGVMFIISFSSAWRFLFIISPKI